VFIVGIDDVAWTGSISVGGLELPPEPASKGNGREGDLLLERSCQFRMIRHRE